MKRNTSALSATRSGFAKLLLLLFVIAFTPALLNAQVKSDAPAAAAASSQTVSDALQQDDAPDADELLVSDAKTVAKDAKKEKLRQKLVQLKSQLEKVQAEKAAQVEVNPDAQPAKTSLLTQLLMKKLGKQTKKMSGQEINQINDSQATKATTGSLVYLGVILAAVGLILALVTTGGAASAGVVVLIVGVVMAVVGLLA